MKNEYDIEYEIVWHGSDTPSGITIVTAILDNELNLCATCSDCFVGLLQVSKGYVCAKCGRLYRYNISKDGWREPISLLLNMSRRADLVRLDMLHWLSAWTHTDVKDIDVNFTWDESWT